MTGTTRNTWTRVAPWVVALALVVGGGSLATAASKGDVFPLDTCPVSGEKLGAMGAPIVYDHEGREIRFCCKGCAAKFKADPARYLTKIDEAIVKQQKPYYPLDTGIVTGKKLVAEGHKPVDYVHNNRLVRLYDQAALQKFKSAPGTYLAKLDKAVIEKQKPTYPLDTCVVLGGKLGAMGKPIEYVTGNRLVRFCCKGCIGAFEKDPLKYLARLDGAGSGKEGPATKQEGSGTKSD